jgi:hypothetical protein
VAALAILIVQRHGIINVGMSQFLDNDAVTASRRDISMHVRPSVRVKSQSGHRPEPDIARGHDLRANRVHPAAAPDRLKYINLPSSLKNPLASQKKKRPL